MDASWCGNQGVFVKKPAESKQHKVPGLKTLLWLMAKIPLRVLEIRF